MINSSRRLWEFSLKGWKTCRYTIIFNLFSLSTGFPSSFCGLWYPVIANTYFFITCFPQDASHGLSFILPYFPACVILILPCGFHSHLIFLFYSIVHNSGSPVVSRGANPPSLVTCLTVAAHLPLFFIKTKQNIIYLTSFFSVFIRQFPLPGEFASMHAWELWASCYLFKQGKILERIPSPVWGLPLLPPFPCQLHCYQSYILRCL